MASLSVFTEGSRGSRLLTNPIFVLSDSGSEIVFEVFEADAELLASTMDEALHLHINSDREFWGCLVSLEPCASEHPGLALLRHKPTLRGIYKVLSNLTGQHGTA